MPKDALVAMLDATSDRVFEFFEKCPPWGSGKDALGNKSVAGVRQSSMLRAKVSEILESVERYEMKAAPLRGGSGPDARSGGGRGRGGGRGGGRGSGGGGGGLQIDGLDAAPALDAAHAPKPKPRLSLLKRGLEEIQELRKEVTDLKQPAAPAAPQPQAAPLAEQQLGAMVERLMQAEVCEHACVLVCLCAC